MKRDLVDWFGVVCAVLFILTFLAMISPLIVLLWRQVL